MCVCVCVLGNSIMNSRCCVSPADVLMGKCLWPSLGSSFDVSYTVVARDNGVRSVFQSVSILLLAPQSAQKSTS